VSEPSPEVLQRAEGRVLFGLDPSGYEAGRPQYPDEVYQALRDRCGLAAGAQVLEIGPGTGLVTKRLLGAGAAVVAVEPNPNLGAFLRATCPRGLRVVQATFEQVELVESAFDLGVAATSFHWVDQPVGLAKLGRLLRPGGAVALWWTLYQDPVGPLDEFGRAMNEILGPRVPASFEEANRPPFQLDVEHRRRDLERWGRFTDVEAEIIRAHRVLTAAQVRALFASVAVVLRRSPTEQARILDAIEGLVRDRFGGRVVRTFVTALYTGRRPVVPVPAS
jgi:SAM-dependent methyltransferase